MHSDSELEHASSTNRIGYLDDPRRRRVVANVPVSEVRLMKIARTAHEVNRAYCASLGDHSHHAWDDAPEWQRESAIKGVEFHIRNPDAGPEASHANWMREKRAAGWLYGEQKDAALKTHPCMVPYEQLLAAQQTKDALFVAVVRSLAP